MSEQRQEFAPIVPYFSASGGSKLDQLRRRVQTGEKEVADAGYANSIETATANKMRVILSQIRRVIRAKGEVSPISALSTDYSRQVRCEQRFGTPRPDATGAK